MTKLRFCMISFCIFLFTLSAIAQIQNGQFSGTVTDASGAAVAGAKVTIVGARPGQRPMSDENVGT